MSEVCWKKDSLICVELQWSCTDFIGGCFPWRERQLRWWILPSKKKIREAAALLGRKGGKSKSPAKVAAARKNGARGGSKVGRPKKIVQDGAVFRDEGGGTYIPQEKKPCGMRKFKAELRMKDAIKTYEKETGIAVAGCTFLEEQFEYLRKIYLIQATLGEMKFSKILPHA